MGQDDGTSDFEPFYHVETKEEVDMAIQVCSDLYIQGHIDS